MSDEKTNEQELRIANDQAAEMLGERILDALPDDYPLLSLKACAYLVGHLAAYCDQQVAAGTLDAPDRDLGSDWLGAARSAENICYRRVLQTKPKRELDA